MRQVMPHRNNMSLHRSRRKIFLQRREPLNGGVTILQQNLDGDPNLLFVKTTFETKGYALPQLSPARAIS
jgi:hypothetical protein